MVELLPAEGYKSCDCCQNQEEGGHYCLLHGETITDMNTVKCSDWEGRYTWVKLEVQENE